MVRDLGANIQCTSCGELNLIRSHSTKIDVHYNSSGKLKFTKYNSQNVQYISSGKLHYKEQKPKCTIY